MISFFCFKSYMGTSIYEEYRQEFFKPEYRRIYDYNCSQRLDGFAGAYENKEYIFQSNIKKRKQIRTIAKHHMFRTKYDII